MIVSGDQVLNAIITKKNLLLPLITIILTINQADAFRNFETTRLQSTAGTGAGSFLMDEATILNPAPLAFFNISSVYLQKSSTDFTPSNNGPPSESEMKGVIITDAKGRVKGSASYRSHEYNGDKRKRISLALAAPVGKTSALGVSAKQIKDIFSDGTTTKIKQITFGITHAVNESFAIGLVAIDPFGEVEEDTRGIIGMQYMFSGFLSIMADLGADYNQNLSDTTILRAALQAKIFEDFFVRFGVFDDSGKREKGNGVGAGWVSPRLIVDFAIKSTDILENELTTQNEEKIKETSFSLSYRF